MVYKKYIKRGNKLFGPYYYESYREDGIAKKKYIGVAPRENSVAPLGKLALIIVLTAVFAALLISFFVFPRSIGMAILEEFNGSEINQSEQTSEYILNESIENSSELILQEENLTNVPAANNETQENISEQTDITLEEQNLTLPEQTETLPITEPNLTNGTTRSSLGERSPLGASPVSTCTTLSSSNTYYLQNNVTSAGGCFTITGNNILLDCNNSFIAYGSGGGDNTYGIYASYVTNTTILNCSMRDTNSGGGNNYGIYFEGTSNGLIANNSIYTNGTFFSSGIYLYNNADNNTIVGNNVSTLGSSTGNMGIFLSYANNATIKSNNISTSGTQTNYGIRISASENASVENNIILTNGNSDNYGISLESGAYNNNLTGNNMSTFGTAGTNYGIYLSIAGNNSIDSNIINTNGTSSNYGFYISNLAVNNNFTSNYIYTNGSGGLNHGIFVDSTANRNTFKFNKIFTKGDSSYGIYLKSDANNSLFDSNILNNTSQWIMAQLNTARQPNNFTNTTFESPNGLVRFYGSFIMNRSNNITAQKLNITLNKAYLNSTNLTFINTSAQITLWGLTASDSIAPFVAEGDSGTFAECSSQRCVKQSYTGGTLIFNVSRWTSYSSGESTTISECGTISSSGVYSLVGNINSSDTCLNIAANNVTLDCRGYRILFNSEGESNSSGISASNKVNITIKDCNIIDVNSSGYGGVSINFTSVNESNIFNNSMFINGTYWNYGIRFLNSTNGDIVSNRINSSIFSISEIYGLSFDALSSNNSVVNNTFLMRATDTTVALLIYSENNSVKGNSISSYGDQANFGIYLSGNSAVRNQISNNSIKTNGSSSYNIGIRTAGGSYNLIYSNFIQTNGTSSNYGIEVIESARDNMFYDNTVRTYGTSSDNYGVSLSGGAGEIINNTFRNNSIFTAGLSNNHGFLLFNEVYNNTVVNNSINTGYSTASEDNGNIGVWINTGSIGNQIINNTIHTNGTFSNYGIYVYSNTGNTQKNNISYNLIISNGTLTGNDGIHISNAHNNSVEKNIIFTNGLQEWHTGIYISASENNTIFGNVVNTSGDFDDYGIALYSSYNNSIISNNISTSGRLGNNNGLVLSSSSNNYFLNTTLRANSTWLELSSGANNSFTNTLFVSQNGSIRILPEIITPADAAVTFAKLYVIYNASYLNSTNLSFMNKSAEIILNSIQMTDPRVYVDYEDDGSFTACSSPQCNNISYSSETFVFNVSSFTSYRAQEQKLPQTAILDFNPASPINYSTQENVTCNGELFRNNVNVTSEIGINVTLGVGSYNYSCKLYENATHEFDEMNDTLVINQSVPSLVITLAPGSSAAEGTETNATGSECPAELTCNLSRNGVLVSNSDIATLAAGIYNYVYNTTGNANYSAKNVSATLTISAAPPEEEGGNGGGSGGGEIPPETCVDSSWSCGSWAACENGMQSRSCTSNCGSSRTDTQVCVICMPSWTCTSFGACTSSGTSTRTCTDSSNCDSNLNKPTESVTCSYLPLEKEIIPGEEQPPQSIQDLFFPEGGGRKECTPEYDCGEWSKCKYQSDTDEVIGGVTAFVGVKEKLCKDKNRCASSYYETTNCTSEVKITIGREKVCEEDLLTATTENGTSPVSNINLNTLKANRLDISFLQGRSLYCPHCYNLVKDSNEEKVDCGGSCKACQSDKLFPWEIIKWALWGFFFLILFFLRKSRKKADQILLKEIRVLIADGKRALANKSERGKALLNYRIARWLNIQIGGEKIKREAHHEIEKYRKLIKHFL